MIKAPVPHDEPQRLGSLRGLRLLDTPAEERFDRITRTAARLFGVPVALVSLVDENRQWFKSRHGLQATETPRDVSFCGHAIASPEALVVNDALADGRFADNPLVTGPPHVRFYAGHPLKGPDGRAVGTLCVIDHQARRFTDNDRRALSDLAQLVEHEFRLEVHADSEARLNAVLNAVIDGIITIDDTGRILSINAAAIRMFGYSPEELLDQNVKMLMPEPYRAGHDGYIQAYLRTGVAKIIGVGREVVGQRKNGVVFPLELAVNRVTRGGRAMFVGVVRDISIRRAAERRLAVQHAATRVLAAGEPVRATFVQALSGIASALGWSSGAFWAVDAPAGVLRCVEFWSDDPERHRRFEDVTRTRTFTPGVGLPGRVWSSARAAWIPDVANDANFPRAPYAQEAGLHGAVGFPVFLGGRTYGVLEFFSRSVEPLDADLIGAMESIGSQMGQYLERRRVEDALAKSEQDLERFFTLSLDLLCIANLDGHFMRVNPAFENLLGYPRAELLAHPFLDFVHPDDRAATLAEMQKLQQGFRTVSFENRYRCRDGRHVWLLWTAAPYPAQGLVYAAARNITDRKQSEAALRESEERFRDLFENASDLIQSVTPHGRYLFVNRAWLHALDYSLDDLSRLTIFDVIAPEYHEHCRNVLQKVLDGDAVGRVEAVFIGRSGRRIAVDGSVTCRFAEGRPVATRGIFRDVTERKEVDRMKNEFISVVSHELRTPLTSIRGSLGLIASGAVGAVPPEAREMIDIACQNTDRLVRLINAMLDLEKIEAGRIVLDLQPLEMGALVRDAMVENQSYAAGFGVTCDVVAAEPALHVSGDRDRLMQVLTNLLSNAAKFSKEGGRVEVSVARAGASARVSVRDYGSGIPIAFRERIFQRFAQADASDAGRRGGTGLGLSICKAIVERHGGHIDFTSEPGSGSTFFFDIPSCAPLPGSLVAPT